jgi:hypothetical protein
MAQAVEVHTRRSGNIGILETDGYINGAEAEPVAEAGEALIQEGAKSLVINLRKSPIANSMASPS